MIVRGKYADIYEESNRTFRENLALYKLRQQIVEHPFRTVKRTMDGGYFLLRRRRKVRCEVALLFLGYNLKRVVNVLGFREIMERLDSISCCYPRFSRLFRKFLGSFAVAPRNYALSSTFVVA